MPLVKIEQGVVAPAPAPLAATTNSTSGSTITGPSSSSPPLQLHNAYSNLYRLLSGCTQVPYRIFISESGDHKAVVSAAWEIRKTRPRALVHVLDNELWTFASCTPADPSNTAPEPDAQYALTQTSTGVFLASTLSQYLSPTMNPGAVSSAGSGVMPSASAGALSTSGQVSNAANSVTTGPATGPSFSNVAPAPYLPFISAIRQLLVMNLASPVLFIPFGQALLSADGSNVLSLDPFLTPVGDIIVKIHLRSSSFRPLLAAISGQSNAPDHGASPAEVPANWPSTVVLAPSAIVASVVAGPLPAPADSSQLLSMLELAMDSQFVASDVYTFSKWIKVRLSTTQELVLWPMDLCFAVPLQSEPSEVPTSPPSWDRLPDLFDDIERQMISAKTYLKGVSETQNQAAGTSSLRDAGRPSESADVKRALANIYPTPPDPQVRTQRMKLDPTDSAMGVPTPAPGAMSGEPWDDDLFGDNQEITEADFNFFDQPEPMDESDTAINPIDSIDPYTDTGTKKEALPLDSVLPSDPMAVDTVPSVELNKESTKESQTREVSVPITKGTIIRGSVEKPRQKSIFSALQFNPAISDALDSKYGSGGRFFVNDPEGMSDDDESMSPSSEHNTEHEGTANPTPNYHHRTVSESGEMSYMQTQDHASNEASHISAVVDYSTDWFRVLSSSGISSRVSVDQMDAFHDPQVKTTACNDTNGLGALLEQVVWDNDMVGSFLTESKEVLVPDVAVLRKTISLFPHLSNVTLGDLLKLSDSTFNSDKESKTEANVTPGSQASAVSGAVGGFPLIPGAISLNGATSSEAPRVGPHTEKPVKSEVFPITTPLFSVNRLNQAMKARAPIIRFWKIFGLSPRSGTKDIVLMVICSNGERIMSACRALVDLFKSTYEGCNLGSVELAGFNNFTDGVIAVSHLESTDITESDSEIYGVSRALGDIERVYIDEADRPKNVVILTVNDDDNVSGLVSVSEAMAGLRAKGVVWQAIRKRKIAQEDTIVVPSQLSMVRLALGVYDKAFLIEEEGQALSENTLTAYLDGLRRPLPAFSLARIPPPKISFKLVPNPPASLMEEDSLMHLCYAVSDDGRWVSAAWSDQWGELTMIDAFCLQKGGTRIRSFEDVCADIWEKSVELAGRTTNHWRVIVAKVGNKMDIKELSTWQRITESSHTQYGHHPVGHPGFKGRTPAGTAQALDQSSQLGGSTSPQGASGKRREGISFVYIVCIQTASSLVVNGSGVFPFEKFEPNVRSSPLSLETAKGTPITPQRSMADMDSPDTYGVNVGTPSNSSQGAGDSSDKQQHEGGEDMVVVDVKDDAYGLLLQGVALQVVQGTLGDASIAKPAIMGLTMKPSSNAGTSDLPLLQVSMIHSPTSPALMMKLLLVQYRRLASLGEAMGVRNGCSTVAPWHVAACLKMLRVLSYVE